MRVGGQKKSKVSWTLPVDMDSAAGIWVKKSMLENWTNNRLREHVIGNGVKWESVFVPLDQSSLDAIEDWWCDQGSEVLNECLESDDAGLHEPGCVAPDFNALGFGLLVPSARPSMSLNQLSVLK